MNVKITNANQPSWKNVTVKSHIPAAFNLLMKLRTTSGSAGIKKLSTFSVVWMLKFGKTWIKIL